MSLILTHHLKREDLETTERELMQKLLELKTKSEYSPYIDFLRRPKGHRRDFSRCMHTKWKQVDRSKYFTRIGS